MTPKRASLLVLLPLLIVYGSYGQIEDAYRYNIHKKIEATHAVVVSAHPLASRAGLSVMKHGGNAIDGAIATQLALAVVYPGAGNLGGGGFMVAHLANGRNLALDYREKAPAKASRDMYLDRNGNPQMQLSQEGHLASGVPGTIAGIFAQLKYARLPLSKLIQPAIELASKGFAITASQAASLNSLKEKFLKLNRFPTAFVKASPWREGDTLVQKDLAGTLRRIRDQGQKGFYEGPTARMIAEEMKKGGGIISLDDLKNYVAKERVITEFEYRGYRVLTMPLPSSGGIVLQQLLKMVEERTADSLTFHSPESVQLITELERRAYADRAEYLGDPDFVKVPVKTLVSETYLRDRMKDFVPGKAGNSNDTKAGSIKESEETTHFSVIDELGNAVSITTTLNDSYGSKTVVKGAGFLLNDEMDDFSVKPGVPNLYGAVGNDKNAIAPGKRMLSSMTPTILLKNGRPFLVVGSPGGTTIPTSVFQTILNILDFKMSAEDAVSAPKFHHQWLPDQIDIEKGFLTSTISNLEKMGYKVHVRGSIGRTDIIAVTNGKFTGVGDPRGDDDAEGY